jgi:hypothetical protein
LNAGPKLHEPRSDSRSCREDYALSTKDPSGCGTEYYIEKEKAESGRKVNALGTFITCMLSDSLDDNILPDILPQRGYWDSTFLGL